jgi:hypothetical protein
MARRRKNKKANRNPTPASNGLNKSLPDLPRGDIPSSAFSSTPDMETPPSEKYADLSEKYTETPTDESPRPRTSKSRKEGSIDRTPPASSHQRELSSANDESRKGPSSTTAPCIASPTDRAADNLTLPASTFQGNRESTLSKNSGISYDTANGDDFFGTVPLLLDTNQNATASPAASNGREIAEPSPHTSTNAPEPKTAPRDYFPRTQSSTSAREVMRESQREPSRSSSLEQKQPASPHIAFQQKGRQTSELIGDAVRKAKETGVRPASPAVGRPVESTTTTSYPTAPTTQTEFKLQEAPKPKKSGSRRSSKDGRSPAAGSPAVGSPAVRSPAVDLSSRNTPRIDGPMATPPKRVESPTPMLTDDFGSPSPNHSKGPSQSDFAPPKRGDSLAASLKGSFTRKEVGSGATTPTPTPTPPTETAGDRNLSTINRIPATDVYQPTGIRNIPKQNDSPNPRSGSEMPNGPPPRASSRPGMTVVANTLDNYASPRAPPPAPPIGHRATASTSTVHTDSTSRMSPTNLPRHSAGADFSLEEEMERIMSGEEKQEPGAFRKLSNAVKHGRSFSDRGARSTSSTQSQKWPKSPLNGSVDISSPTSATSPDSREEAILYKNRLRQAQERIAKLEVERNRLQGMVDGSADISLVNTELRQKRSTMAILDTQREIVVRELEVMTEHLRKAKEANQALDLTSLKNDVLRDFAGSLQRLKDNLGAQIEELMQKRNELTREIDDLIQMKDKGFQEYESLSSRNHQLTQHNNELISSIQGSMKAVAHQKNGTPVESSVPPPNGLGLYIQHSKEKSDTSSELRSLMNSEYSNPNLLNDNENDGTVLATPQVVKISGKGKPNMLKKGTQGFVKGLRNMRGNLVNERNDRPIERNNNGQWVEGTPYSQLPVQSDPASNVTISRPFPDPAGKQKFGGFFGEKPDKSHLKHLKNSHNNSNPSLASDSTSSAATQLFGSDLGARCEYEMRVIPCIVSRCIEEVELRGMDVEGVYRKSGGSGQVNAIRMGFEKDNDYDISEPELDIHAVTSTLKQYFRRLPVPLITFDVYDQMLNASKVEDVDKRAVAMRDAINALPKSHRDCLEFLVFHLAKVMSHESENLVS